MLEKVSMYEVWCQIVINTMSGFTQCAEKYTSKIDTKLSHVKQNVSTWKWACAIVKLECTYSSSQR